MMYTFKKYLKSEEHVIRVVLPGYSHRTCN
ncbi:hypothetical protein AGR7A_Cc60059 [Agrobacterium deltaense NCPPB 1641]|uniref:Uncharacterized protein n=1 Tax=Agrobacterium deltaense NCPPB 1641 TaxID=1183425 RepID=A0A1S7TRP2_9HYPH|nr:hypothetical protein AGR7A_Cc60059 [Agrobacterium deltaense NCPPB 1641]